MDNLTNSTVSVSLFAAAYFDYLSLLTCAMPDALDPTVLLAPLQLASSNDRAEIDSISGDTFCSNLLIIARSLLNDDEYDTLRAEDLLEGEGEWVNSRLRRLRGTYDLLKPESLTVMQVHNSEQWFRQFFR